MKSIVRQSQVYSQVPFQSVLSQRDASLQKQKSSFTQSEQKGRSDSLPHPTHVVDGKYLSEMQH